uniref:Uncharacterized protein n=1 Tax=Leersia perrieri TaxID=77586 RepID=A0A0D9XPI4_9ORYZ
MGVGAIVTGTDHGANDVGINGVVRLVESTNDEKQDGESAVRRRKALIHTASGEVVADLEQRLTSMFQFHKRGCLDLISLPANFARFSSLHMYDIVLKNRHSFRVDDV